MGSVHKEQALEKLSVDDFSTTSKKKPSDEENQWLTAWNRISPKALACLKDRSGKFDLSSIRRYMALAQEKAEVGQYSAALEYLKYLEILIKMTFGM